MGESCKRIGIKNIRKELNKAFNKLSWQDKTRTIIAIIFLTSYLWILNYQTAQDLFSSRTIFIDNVEASGGEIDTLASSASENARVGEKSLASQTDRESIEDTHAGKGEDLTTLPKQSDLEDMICKEFKEDCKVAIAVAKAESRLNPSAVGDTHLSKPSYGLFQISQIYHNYSVETLLNPAENIKIAKQIKDSGGFERWTTYREGTYLNYL